MSASNAADIDSVDCTPPYIIVNFDAAVSTYTTSTSDSLTSIKLKKIPVPPKRFELEPRSGTWNDDRDNLPFAQHERIMKILIRGTFGLWRLRLLPMVILIQLRVTEEDIMKIINGIITLALMISPSFAATLSSVDCSSTEIV